MKNTFRVVCSTESLSLIRAYAAEQLKRLSVPEETATEIVLAIDEACANNIIHQHNCDGSTEFEISIFLSGKQLIIEIKDEGEPFPINEYEPADLKDLVESGKRGGLGISLITRIMDKVEVIRDGKYYVYKFTRNLNGGHRGTGAS